ncbi:hypothetical protein [Leptospira harrisiae]|uniref:CDP-glycerol--glycerophosphate glycerophosphotransferase n=1 Tax=Leptospira harrisiae TaxID=2023189 RepID=A0A2N0APT4_9LEPT|nr:hypothetical protein [Leptospira harrisiae]PJZ86307.1 hypothetical protein CH364_09120 [Leptospira harrisiae]PKA09872.1 hypothetical protein CH366_09390 [Leptospira harrisiae]
MKADVPNQPVTIYLIADRPLDKRFWAYWIFDLLDEIPIQFEVLQLTYVHDFLKEIKEDISSTDTRIHITKFLDETSLLAFLDKNAMKRSLVFFYTWVSPNAYMKVISFVDKNFENYYYLMHGVGDNSCDSPISPNVWESLRNFYKKIRFIIGMMRRFKGAKYWFDSTRMRIKAQYPYFGPFGYRTKFIVTGNHFQERFLKAKEIQKIELFSKNKKTALWLDQNLPNVFQFGYKIEVDPEKYYAGLSILFRHLNDIGYDVYLTLHPDVQENDKMILENQYLKNTAKILDIPSEVASINVDLILTHDSTASYFGVLANKPIVSLMYRHLKDEHMIDSIKGLSQLLNTPLIHFDENEFDLIDFDHVSVDEKSYHKFARNFILGDQKGSPYKFMKSLIKKEIESIK